MTAAFPVTTKIRRIFIDEITAIEHWELALKRLSDQGKLRDILVITTGSKATDLRRGAEKLPGRKGRLARTTAYHPQRIRRIEDFLALTAAEQGIWYEWLVAQELSRRHAIAGQEILEPLTFWQNAQHEVDFVDFAHEFLEVKRGACTPVEFAWFAKQFPHKTLKVINPQEFQTAAIQGLSLEHFLLT